jgi:hypothetical protein
MGQAILAPGDDIGHRTHRPRKKSDINSYMYIVTNGYNDNRSSSHGDSNNFGSSSAAVSDSGGNKMNKGEIIINNTSSNSSNSSITEAHIPFISVDVATATINPATTINSAAATGVHSASTCNVGVAPVRYSLGKSATTPNV